MKCNCTDWADNIEELNAPLLLQAARSGFQRVGYNGVKFRYCPWCSKPLEFEMDEVVCGALANSPA